MRVVVGDIEISVRPGYAFVENGRVDEADIADLRAALAEAQNILRRQQ